MPIVTEDWVSKAKITKQHLEDLGLIKPRRRQRSRSRSCPRGRKCPHYGKCPYAKKRQSPPKSQRQPKRQTLGPRGYGGYSQFVKDFSEDYDGDSLMRDASDEWAEMSEREKWEEYGVKPKNQKKYKYEDEDEDEDDDYEDDEDDDEDDDDEDDDEDEDEDSSSDDEYEDDDDDDDYEDEYDDEDEDEFDDEYEMGKHYKGRKSEVLDRLRHPNHYNLSPAQKREKLEEMLRNPEIYPHLQLRMAGI